MPQLPDAVSRHLAVATERLRREANPPAWRGGAVEPLVLAYLRVRDAVLAGRARADDLQPDQIAGCWVYLAGSAARALVEFDRLAEAGVDPEARWPRVRRHLAGGGGE